MTNLIQTQRQLEKYIETIIHDSYLAIDTEFKRIDTYYPELCLVQIATSHSIECIDVLSIDNLEPLFEKIYNKKTLWIVHSARQDIEALFKLSKQIPNALFDTQIAASLLNYPVQISYKALTEELQGVHLKKDHTRFDWTIRPLPKSVLDYALDDVRYLIPNYKKLVNELKLNNKTKWQEEDSAYLLDPSLYDLSIEQVWNKTKGVSRLSKKHQEEAMKLVAWREKNAKEKNIPRKWIMADKKLIDYACGKNKLSEKSQKSFDEFIINSKNNFTIKDLAKINKPLNASEKNAKKELQRNIKMIAKKYKLPTEIIITSKSQTKFIRGDTNISFCRGWRAKIFNKEEINAK